MWIGTNGRCTSSTWYIVLYNRDSILDIWFRINILGTISNIVSKHRTNNRMGRLSILYYFNIRIYLWVPKRSITDWSKSRYIKIENEVLRALAWLFLPSHLLLLSLGWAVDHDSLRDGGAGISHLWGSWVGTRIPGMAGTAIPWAVNQRPTTDHKKGRQCPTLGILGWNKDTWDGCCSHPYILGQTWEIDEMQDPP